MALNNNGKNVMLNGSGLAANALYMSLHTADPGTTGTSEVSGGSPAYARKAITWAAASGGSMSMTGTLTFDIPASTTVTHLGLWSASSAGTFYGSADPSDEAFTSQGQLVIDTATVSL